ncbi:uncharacterized protein YifN (PemK superfamily) [Rhodobacter viridis]|uniref:Uncharacterized protein YifN (PemK superfamily) n=1 Tax=Rhodobacter viridis TaxID=1054202 RepID=A0A318TSK6_9RHOB|nr:type II toxin-antitoxin system PemK/MazF family toxin [Rhodobacter viridis]PYF07831.1 uncharacterized protein YifN (PemK superfamily) [Rhodobacter viridis]
MPIQYDQTPGTILVCDFSAGGFKAPEMVKPRPVVVISKRKRRSSGLLTVVPLSTTAPDPVLAHHCQITLEKPLPHPRFDKTECWVKGDMVTTVSFQRLDLFRTDRGPGGARKYVTVRVSDAQLAQIMACIREVFGL